MEEVGGVDGEGDGRGRRGRMLRKQGERIKIIYYMANSFISTLIRLRRGGGGRYWSRAVQIFYFSN